MNTELENKDLTSNDAKPMLAEVIDKINVDSLLQEYGNEVIYELGDYLQKLSTDDAFEAIRESNNFS